MQEDANRGQPQPPTRAVRSASQAASGDGMSAASYRLTIAFGIVLLLGAVALLLA
jgi:hypothetical protein